MDEKERYRIGGNRPEPVQGVLRVPRRFVDVAHGGVSRQGGNGLVVGQDGL